MSSKRIIVKRNNQYISAWWQDGSIVQIDVDDVKHEKLTLGTIYVARVKDIVKNIQAAFLEIETGKMAYYALKDNPNPIMCQCARTGTLTVGDLLVVQIAKEAMKTKFAVAESKINLTGRYLVLIHEPAGICFSAKIKDTLWKKKVQAQIQSYLEEQQLSNINFGYIVRTNAYTASSEEILQDLEYLTEQYRNICQVAPYRKAGACLKKMPEEYLLSIRDSSQGVEQIITDEPEIYQNICDFMKENNIPKFEVQLYQDKLLPLMKLYSIEKSIELALKDYVWLKSGAYLVIQPTEALTVIDVNTGKITGNKNQEETFLKVNLEAVIEIAKQIRLRNYSGIIIIDFINMKQMENRQLLMRKLEEEVQKDSVKTTVVDMTKLELVELTRQKKRAPLYEVIKSE